MLQQITRIFVDLATPAFPAVVHAKQDDGGARFIYATLMENGVEYIPPAGVIGIVRIRKPDGKACVYDSNDQDLAAVIVDGSTVQVELVTQALTAAGSGTAEVGLYDAEGNRLTSFNFRLEIEASAVADAEFVSTDFINVLSAKIGEVAALVQSIQALTVSAVTLPAGSSAKVEKTQKNGVINFEFGIPTGPQGPEGPQGPTGPQGEGANIAYNLLDNSDFTNPVNQRGQTNYTGVGYTIDRWRMFVDSSAFTVGNGYITVSGHYLYQVLEYYKPNTVYTLAVKELDGTLTVRSHTFENGGSESTDFYLDNGLTRIRIGFEGSIKNYVWADLYEGEYTAETLPKRMPKGYGVELAECLQYFRVYATDSARPEKGMDCSPPMRINNVTQGTLTIDGATCYFNSADL